MEITLCIGQPQSPTIKIRLFYVPHLQIKASQSFLGHVHLPSKIFSLAFRISLYPVFSASYKTTSSSFTRSFLLLMYSSSNLSRKFANPHSLTVTCFVSTNAFINPSRQPLYNLNRIFLSRTRFEVA